ncbi:MAG: 6-bladed beta-propeller [Draconibacterium sp.]
MKTRSTRLTVFLFIFILLYNLPGIQGKAQTLKPTIPNADLITIDVDNIGKGRNIMFSEIFKQVKLVPLETTRECLIGNIDQLLIENDTIYVMDQRIAKSLFVFDKTGKFIRKIGRQGKGPGEYISPRSFAIDNKNRRINVYGVSKILNYTLNGDFMNEINTRGRSVKEIANLDGIIYVDHDPIPQDKNSTLLTAYDKDGKEVNTWLPNGQYNHGFQQHSGYFFHLIKTPYDIKYIRPFFDTIFCINNQQLTPFIAIETRHRVTQSEMKKINSIPIMELGEYFMKNGDYFRGPSSYTENERLIMAQLTLPDYAIFWLINPKNKKYIIGVPKDDLTNGVIPIITTVTDDCFVFTTNMGYTNMQLIEGVKDGSIKLDKAEKEKVLKLTPDSNPVIMFYECREDFLED